MDWLSQPDIWLALFTLTLLEIVLGIDNVVFLSILADKLPVEQRTKARQIGLALALIMRLLLLFSLSWIVKLTDPIMTVPLPTWLNEHGGHPVSWRDLILLGGGLFLVAKSTMEIHHSLEGDHGAKSKGVPAKFGNVLAQIVALDIVFSLDSVITAVGMVDKLGVMIAAVVLSMIFMLLAAGSISRFISRHPTIKMLALSFLLLIGFTLMAEGLHQHIPKGYVYFAMAFSVFVEVLNFNLRAPHTKPVELKQAYVAEPGHEA